MRLAGKRVWITGASSGIGEALAYVLAERGCKLILSSRRETVLEEVRHSLPRPDEHVVVPLDLARADELEALGKAVVEKHGPVDVLINNGGVSQRSRAIETEWSVVREIMEINFFGAVALTRGVLPSMLERNQGRIVVVSSVVGLFSTPKRSSYSAAKHALHGFFESLRLELWESTVGVSMVVPGYVKTAVSQNAYRGDGQKHGRLDDGQAGGVSPEACAIRIARGIERDEDEVLIGGMEVAGVYLKRFAPKFFDRVLRKVNAS